MRALVFGSILLLPITLAATALAQSAPESQTAYCNFDDGTQITVEYNPTVAKNDEPRNGKLWTPGGTPMVLFAQTALILGGSPIPTGGYHMFVIPGRNNWTLVVNKNVTAGSKYDEKDNIAKGQMDIGSLGEAEKDARISFAHSGPKLCSMRIDHGKTGAFVDFKEQ
ncbi:MAG TPA: DUF2911 domain-containing protein [Terriglobales bacterium]|nr:DUF2911 domain-containing protein [Terriglobales bacterium]